MARSGPPGPRRPRPRSERERRRRALGQNFLVDGRVARRVVAVAGVTAGDLVVDLGAGRGALTRPLSARGADVVAVEVDPEVAGALRRDLADGRTDRRGTGGHVEVVIGDALTVGLPTSPFRVVANPPFGVTTSLLRRLLSGDVPLRDATLVLQLETARRVSGAPAAGRFSLTWAPWFELVVREPVPRTAFRPVPATDAAILTVRPRSVPWLSPARFGAWESFVDRIFAASGRTAADRLDLALGQRTAARVAGDARVDVVRPPSRLPVEAWLALFRALPR